MSAVDELWILVAALIVLDLQAGFLALEAGMVRAKNAANVALKNLSDVCLVALAFWAVGFGLMFGPSVGGVIGLGPFLPDFDDAAFGDGFATLFVFQAAFAATAATIISGAVAERERYVGYICLSITLGAVVYPVAGHWVWAGGLMDGSEGWLQALGFVDFAGATVVHSVGGWAALVAVIALGPRLGRFTRRKRRYEAHSIAMVALGGLFLWIGWGAFNGGSAMMFDKSVGPIIGRTLLTAAAGGAAAIALSMLLYGHLRAEALINGVLAGLVAGTAGIHLFDSADSVLVGAVGAVACMAMTELLEALHIDDVVGAVPVHLGAGVWGTLAVALVVAPEALPTGDRWEQLAVQATGAAAVGLWVVSTVGLLALGLRGAGLLRASKRAEVVGLSVAENRQHSAFLELIEEMKRHQRSGSFSRRVNVERSSEIGALAHRYNRVLDRVEGEISARMNAMRSEREMRRLAEQAFDAMRKAKEESARAARRDTLTGLGNRKLLDELIDTPSRSAAGRFMVAAIDLDRFKDVNDSYGHEAGDAVLVATAQRMLTRLDEGRDFAFRIGGDEFVVLMELGPDDADPQDFCAWLLADLSEAIPYRGVALRCGGSIGYAVAEGDQPLRAALRQADLALYEAKAQGRNAARAYTPASAALKSLASSSFSSCSA
ncbi:MAG: diguanylate cyclase, partial [Pseudomonadota bacterium]